MKITLPENISEITLGQYQKLDKLAERDDLPIDQLTKRKIEIFTGLSRKEIDNIRQSDYAEISEQIDKALSTDCEFVNRFEIGGKEFGFIPNFDNITTGEYVDLCEYSADSEKTHNLMAVMFRPITKKDSFGNYLIENYQGSERYASEMKDMPMSIVKGALFFFASLSIELENYIQKSMRSELAREKRRQNISRSGDGTLR